MEVSLGHFTFAFLLRRCCLATFRACYTFAARLKRRTGRIWNSALVELRIAAALLVLVESDFQVGWSQTVTVADAAPHGFAIHETEWSLAEVQGAGESNERWRFRRSQHPEPRNSALREWQAFTAVEGPEALPG